MEVDGSAWTADIENVTLTSIVCLEIPLSRYGGRIRQS